MKILAFAGSNSSTSINKKLVTHVSTYFGGHEITLLDLNDFEIPLYSIDLEKASGIPSKAMEFSNLIKVHELILLSLAEHNGSYTAVFKNLFDWLSRIDGTKGFHKKDMFVMATSPGARGGKGVLNAAKERFEFNDGNIIASFSLPSFNQNFDETSGITNTELKQELEEIITTIKTR